MASRCFSLAAKAFIFTAVLAMASAETGLTGDSCSTDAECLDGRRCLIAQFENIASQTGCTPSSSPCVCVPTAPVECTSSSQCDHGERCTKLFTFVTLCGSCNSDIPNDPVDETTNCATRTPTPSMSPTPSVAAESTAPSMSAAAASLGASPVVESPSIPPAVESAVGSTESPSASISALASGTVASSVSPSVSAGSEVVPDEPDVISPAASESETESPDENDPICIDANALSHLPASEKVFKEDRRAAVLCDQHGSCATPGHIITWNNSPMLMRSYCANHAESCTRRVMNVNSPRMRRRTRVQSKTSGLHFTALAARYESSIEEKILQVLVHTGL